MSRKKTETPPPGLAVPDLGAHAYVRIAFPLPIGETYWYRNNDEKPVQEGCRAEAPFGRRSLVGFVIETAVACPLDPALVRPIKRAVDGDRIFAEPTVRLAEWVARM